MWNSVFSMMDHSGIFFLFVFCFVLFPNTETVNGHRDGRLSWPQQRHALRGRLRGKHQPVSVTPSATLFGDFLWMPNLLINTADIFWVFHMIVKIYLLLPNTQTYTQLLPAPCSYDISLQDLATKPVTRERFFPSCSVLSFRMGAVSCRWWFFSQKRGFFCSDCKNMACLFKYPKKYRKRKFLTVRLLLTTA